jgi:hypothetical protein
MMQVMPTKGVRGDKSQAAGGSRDFDSTLEPNSSDYRQFSNIHYSVRILLPLGNAASHYTEDLKSSVYLWVIHNDMPLRINIG